MNFYSLLIKKFERFTSSVAFKSVFFYNLLVTNVFFSSKAWSTINSCCYFYVLLYHLISSCINLDHLDFYFVYMLGSCLNPVLRFKFICNKCQCLLIICFIFGNVLLYVITKGILFWSFSNNLGASNRFHSISELLKFFIKKSFIETLIYK